MGGDSGNLSGPDLGLGVPIADVPTGGPLLGHSHGEAVMLVRSGDDLLAVGATGTHYSGPLAEGLVVGDTVRCPWHHACFSLRTGEALRAPALNPIACYSVLREGDLVRVGAKLDCPAPPRATATAAAPARVVIVGGGAAGAAAAEMLRREGHQGAIHLISADTAGPYDRPNLSKDYLAGTAPEDWLPLRPPEFYAEQRIELELGTRATAINPKSRELKLGDGKTLAWDALLLATGAEPIRLAAPGAELPHVHTLRTLEDSRSIIAGAVTVSSAARRAVVVGASFIGMEVAAALRARNIEVHVVAPDAEPFARVLGPQVGAFFRALHQEHGVFFHLGQTVKAVETRAVTLSGGGSLEADLVVVGIGVRPVLALAESAGLKIDRGVLVNQLLETSVPGIFAAGDIARWPDPISGQNVRVEHWVVAQRMGQTAAKNILGRRQPFAAAPFFWSAQYDVTLSYVGHAETWDDVQIDGSLAARDCTISYRNGGRTLAVATIGRDRVSLEAEVELERKAKPKA